jgi:hypothetical protein
MKERPAQEALHMFGLLKFLFYTFVAVVVGVLIGTVPVGGHTVSERIAAAYQGAPQMLEAQAKKLAPSTTGSPKAAARTGPRAKAIPTPLPAPPSPPPNPTALARGPLTAGAANSPEAQSDEDKRALDKVIAARVKGR